MGDHGKEALEGKCPFCGAQGLITDPSGWCEHHAGTYDLMMGSQPVDCLEKDGEFIAFREFLASFQNLSDEKQQRLLKTMPEGLSKFVRGVVDNPPELFWLGQVPAKSLSADVSESLFDTTYMSIFVEDPESARNSLRKVARSIMANARLD